MLQHWHNIRKNSFYAIPSSDNLQSLNTESLFFLLLFLLLQEKYNDAASELIVYTYFFSASEEALPEVMLWIGDHLSSLESMKLISQRYTHKHVINALGNDTCSYIFLVWDNVFRFFEHVSCPGIAHVTSSDVFFFPQYKEFFHIFYMIYESLSKVVFLCFQQSVSLPELPAVVVFKDGGYFTYDGKYFICFRLCPLLLSCFVFFDWFSLIA